MTITKKGCARGLATIALALTALIGLLFFLIFGGNKMINIVTGGFLERQAAAQEAEREQRIEEAKAQREIAEIESLSGLGIAAKGAWLVLEGGFALVLLGASGSIILGSWRLAMGKVRSLREGATIGHAFASRQPVPQTITYSPAHRNQITIKDVTSEQLAQLPLAASASGDMAGQLTAILASLGLTAIAKQAAIGPQVVTMAVTPKANDKGKMTTVSAIRARADDLAVALAVQSVRIAAAAGYVAIEIPRQQREMVELSDLLNSQDWQATKSNLPLLLGKDTGGKVVIADLFKLPHLLLSGSTGGGKSVALNALIVALMKRFSPKELKFILIDPKQVEMIPYESSPYLHQPLVTDITKAAGVLQSAIEEMERRYTTMAAAKKRNIISYNRVAEVKLPWLVIVVDELGDLMLVAKDEIEETIVRLGQKARAAGIHLILATQRPSTDVITGLIKANLPARMAMTVTDGVNSEIILDERGAEALLGEGDALFKAKGLKTTRLQAPFIGDEELEQFLNFAIANQTQPVSPPLLPAVPSTTVPLPAIAPPQSHSLAASEGSAIANQAQIAERNCESEHDCATAIVPRGLKGVVYRLLDANPELANQAQILAQAINKPDNHARAYVAAWRKERGIPAT